MNSLPQLDLAKAGKLLMFPASFQRLRAISLPALDIVTQRPMHINVFAEEEVELRFGLDLVSFNAIDTLEYLQQGAQGKFPVGNVTLPYRHYLESDIKRSPTGYLGLLPDIQVSEFCGDRFVIPISMKDGGFSRVQGKPIHVCVNEHVQLYSPALDAISDKDWKLLSSKESTVFTWNELRLKIKRSEIFLPFDFDKKLLNAESRTVPEAVLNSLWQSLKKYIRK